MSLILVAEPATPTLFRLEIWDGDLMIGEYRDLLGNEIGQIDASHWFRGNVLRADTSR